MAAADNDGSCRGELIDLRQPELHSHLGHESKTIFGMLTRARAGVPAHKNLFQGINEPVDEIDKQIWAISYLNGGVEVGIFEVIDRSGRRLALSRFYIGSKTGIKLVREDLFSIIDRLRIENNVKFSEIGYVGWRHNHPPGLLKGIFSGGDMAVSFTLQDALENRYGVRFPVQMTVLWKSILGRVVDLATSSEAISKMSARTIQLNGETLEGPYVKSLRRRIPLVGYPEADVAAK